MSKLLGMVVAAAVAVAGLASPMGCSSRAGVTGTVVRVIDGDTLVAVVAKQETTIRLLNVDTPETKDPNQPPECLGPEATDFLNGRLPEGTEVTLKYDTELTDRYGRTLAAVFESDSLVNAEIAAKGLGAAVVFEPNHKYYGEVLAAQQAAQAAGVGLYDPQVTCTLPAEVERVVESLQQVSSYMPANSAAASAAMSAAAAAIIVGQGLDATLDAIDAGDHALRTAAYGVVVADYRTRLNGAMAEGNRLKNWHREQLVRLKAEEAKAAEKARLAEAAKLAEDARRAKLAEEARRAAEARKAAIAAAARLEAKRAATRTTAPRPTATTAPVNPYPGYTGPRCYAPGGKTWKPC